jgi:hypothetical protein
MVFNERKNRTYYRADVEDVRPPPGDVQAMTAVPR